MRQHKKPCGECPWRRTCAPGWLGNATPEQFLATSEAEHRMPCHSHVDYEDENWRAQVAKAPQCAGRAIHFANRFKLPRNKDLLQLPADRENVFNRPEEFLEHHQQFDYTFNDSGDLELDDDSYEEPDEFMEY